MRLVLTTWLLAASCLIGLNGCSGNQGNNAGEGAKHSAISQKTTATPASSYNQVVEQLYVAYFGRPADPNGLANFSAQLAADGAPTDILSLLQAYKTNSGVKALIDSFGSSTESLGLYGTANPTSFVTAVFKNVLGRAPQTSGLDFWVAALNNGSATYGNVALQIMAGAQVNTTTQGQQDAALIANRIEVATEFTADVSSQNATADYSGSAAAQTARNMLAGITASTSSSTFQSTVDSTVATLIANPPAVNNTVAIAVDQGPDPNNYYAINIPYITLTICAPGNPSICQTIQHIQVDTGSSGLRLISEALTPQMASALSAQSSGSTVTECLEFLDGYSWGPVRRVNLSISGETASNLPMQVIGDPDFMGLVPGDCSGDNKSENDIDSFGANGIIGVGFFQQDCGSGCASNPDNGEYYLCVSSSGQCNGTSLALDQQVQNPVALFPADNNGVIITLPSVGLSPPNTVSGTLVFGVNTQSNNALGSASVFQMDESGLFTTIFAGTAMSDSFIDSGSNGLYFPNQTNIKTCNDTFYCPDTPLSLSAQMVGLKSKANGMQNSQVVSFYIGDANTVPGSVSVDYGASSTPGSFDWGLPFFYGRSVYVALDGVNVGGQTGPFVAF